MTIIKADTLLAILLTFMKRVTFRSLRQLRDMMLDKNKDVVLDISAPSIQQAIDNYPNIFMFGNDGHLAFIKRANGSKCFFASDYIRDEFISSVPDNVVDDITKCYLKIDQSKGDV